MMVKRPSYRKENVSHSSQISATMEHSSEHQQHLEDLEEHPLMAVAKLIKTFFYF